MSDAVDVLVIGAGPAGSIAASVIHRAGLKVRVVEREKFPRFVIGESLLPRCMEVFEDAGFMEALNDCHFQQKFGAKFVRGESVSDFNFSEQFSEGWTWTWQVPRATFDMVLANRVQEMGVTVEFEKTVTQISFDANGRSRTTVTGKDGKQSQIESAFIVDASGYGRVIPKMFNLEKPSTLDPRKAVFAHVKDEKRNEFDEPNRITIILYQPGVWVWIIPFSTGVTSVGFVADFPFFEKVPGDLKTQFESLIENHKYLKKRFADADFTFEPRKLEAWSATTDSFFGNGFVLTGNVTEFLDPIFSSGVMFATVSSHLAANLVVRKLRGEIVDWDTEYTKVIKQGVDTFRSYVTGWYDGTLEKIFFATQPDPMVKKQICSVLAGYVWDQKNPFVRHHDVALRRLAKLIEVQEAFDKEV